MRVMLDMEHFFSFLAKWYFKIQTSVRIIAPENKSSFFSPLRILRLRSEFFLFQSVAQIVWNLRGAPKGSMRRAGREEERTLGGGWARGGSRRQTARNGKINPNVWQPSSRLSEQRQEERREDRTNVFFWSLEAVLRQRDGDEGTRLRGNPHQGKDASSGRSINRFSACLRDKKPLRNMQLHGLSLIAQLQT